MATNRLPTKFDVLFTLAGNMADAAATHGVAIGLLQNTEARIRADLNAARTAHQTFLTAREAKIALTAAQNQADIAGRAFLAAAKNALAPSLGNNWNSTWATAGFIESLAVPKALGERMSVIGSMRDYLTANPAREVAALNVTAAIASTRYDALSDARSAANNALYTVGVAKAAWFAAKKTLERRMRGMINEIGQLVEGDSSIWYAFGLNPPDAETTPDAPDDLTLNEGPNYSVLADWEHVPNADYYRVFVAIGADNENFAAEPTTFGDSDATLGPFQEGQTVRVKVTAVSGGLEGPASGIVELTLEGASGNGGGAALTSLAAAS